MSSFVYLIVVELANFKNRKLIIGLWVRGIRFGVVLIDALT